MKTRVAALVLSTLLAFMPCLARAQQGVVGSITFSGSLSAPGNTIPLPLTQGMQTCGVVVSGSFTGATATAQNAADHPESSAAATFTTATNLGAGGVVSNANTYSGNVVQSGGLTWFRVNLSALSTGTWNYTETCTVANSGGAAPSSVNQGNPGSAASPWFVAPGTGSVFPISCSAPSVCPAGVGVNANGAGQSILACMNNAPATATITTATTTQLIPLVAAKAIHVCSWTVDSNGTNVANLEYGTGTNCGTGTTPIDVPAVYMVAQFAATFGQSIGQRFATPSGQALCIVDTQAATFTVSVIYEQY